MPIHDYRCAACGTQFEALVRGDATPPCPQCGGGVLERLVSRIAPAGQAKRIVAGARRQAQREGHFSQYSKADQAKAGKG